MRTHLHINSKLPYADDTDTNDIKPLNHIPTHTHGVKMHMFVLLHHTFSHHVSARENRLSPNVSAPSASALRWRGFHCFQMFGWENAQKWLTCQS